MQIHAYGSSLIMMISLGMFHAATASLPSSFDLPVPHLDKLGCSKTGEDTYYLKDDELVEAGKGSAGEWEIDVYFLNKEDSSTSADYTLPDGSRGRLVCRTKDTLTKAFIHNHKDSYQCSINVDFGTKKMNKDDPVMCRQ